MFEINMVYLFSFDGTTKKKDFVLSNNSNNMKKLRPTS